MAKHILEGRYFPFYFYGTSYNASCAWEACLAVVPFAIAGVGVVALKIPTVLLSLVCLTLFYMMTTRLYSIRMATLSSLIFALWLGLLKGVGLVEHSSGYGAMKINAPFSAAR
jgi:hypothetical protein